MNDHPPESSLKELTALAPVLAPAFAFAFVIGYFGGIDISWLSFFSMSDQVLFALRALPVAIAASAFFAGGLNYKHLSKQHKWLEDYKSVFAIAWGAVLILFSGITFYEARIGLSAAFLGMAIGHVLYYTTLPNGSSTKTATSIAEVLYWAGILMFITFIIGYISALPYILELQQHSSVKTKSSTILGNVVFSGQKYLLIYQSRSDSARISDCKPTSPTTIDNTLKGYTRLILWKDVTTIDLCPNQPPSPSSPSPPSTPTSSPQGL